MKKYIKDINKAFLFVQEEFPFGKEYLKRKRNKYISIIKQIFIDHPVGSKILSIGSGPCDLEAILSKLGYKVTAIDDLNDQWHMTGNNKERIIDFTKRMNIEFISQSVSSSIKKDNYFDVVLLIDIIEHLHNSPRDLLNYSISSLRPNGLIIIETPNAVSLLKRLKVLFGKSSHINANLIYWNIGEYRSHFREYTRSELRQILNYHNLISLDIKMMNIAIDDIDNINLLKKIVVEIYKLICDLYPNFRDTILLSGKKPENWYQTNISIKNFKKSYHTELYDVDKDI